jgi:hypothetical protein
MKTAIHEGNVAELEETEKSVRNKLTADRSTTELRWIFPCPNNRTQSGKL